MRTGNELSGKYWPVHLKPKPDELFSSWMIRLATGHGLKLHSFCAMAFGRKTQIWNRDPDSQRIEEMINLLCQKTGTPVDRISQMLLDSYDGVVFSQLNKNANTRWILPLGVYHRIRKRNGLVFCPLCLADLNCPYYKKFWRLSFCVVCPEHHILMHDCCPNCGAPVMPHRLEMGDRSKIETMPINCCWNCGNDLSLTACISADTRLIQYQLRLHSVMNEGYANIPEYGKVRSFHFFDGLWSVLSVLHKTKNNSKKPRLFEYVCKQLAMYPDDSSRPEKKKYGLNFNRLPLESRRQFLLAAGWLLEEESWPSRFIESCLASRTTNYLFTKDKILAPYWLYKIIRENLYIVYTPWKSQFPQYSGWNSYKNVINHQIKLKKKNK